MKYIVVALIGLGLLNTGFAQAETSEVKRTHIIKKNKPSVYKKTSKPAAKPTKIQSHRKKAQPKKTVYKNVTKRAVNPATNSTAITQPATTATPKTTEETAYQKLSGWLGLDTGAAATAATTASVAHHKAAGYHTGPRKEKWNHTFESYWGNRGFEVGVNPNGHWVFGSYRPNWWEKNYPIYYKDVVGRLYRESEEYKKTLAK